jgi:hypothetical protein
VGQLFYLVRRGHHRRCSFGLYFRPGDVMRGEVFKRRLKMKVFVVLAASLLTASTASAQTVIGQDNGKAGVSVQSQNGIGNGVGKTNTGVQNNSINVNVTHGGGPIHCTFDESA